MSSYPVTGACKFCGQIQTLMANNELTDGAADDYITSHCRCEGATRFRVRGELMGSIEDLFGDDCDQYGFEPEDDDVIHALAALASDVLDGRLLAAQAVTPSMDTAKLERKGGEIVVTRVLRRKKSVGSAR